MIPLTRAMPERIRAGYDDALYKPTFTLLYYSLSTIVSSAQTQTPTDIQISTVLLQSAISRSHHASLVGCSPTEQSVFIGSTENGA